MMRCDAVWLKEALASLPAASLSPLLNIGSSTAKFREIDQPFIQELVFAPLAAAGVRVIHNDIKASPGVDVVGDIFEDRGFQQLKELGVKAVICTHMFEHVLDRDLLARRLMALLPVGGYFFITVPSSYHRHNDPIDMMYRPTPDQLAGMFPGEDILEKRNLIGQTSWMHIKKWPVTLFFRHFLRFWIPFFGWRQWKRSMGKLYWLFNHYKVAAISGRKAVVSAAPAR